MAYERAGVIGPGQPTLFSTQIEVDDELPLLLDALARVSKKRPEELVEAWALDESRTKTDGPRIEVAAAAPAFSPEVRPRVAELLDIAQTLFEETVADAERRLGGYPSGRAAEQSAVAIYDGLRRLLGLSLE